MIKEMKQSVIEVEERQQRLDGKVRYLEDSHRNNNILNFGMEEREDKGYFETLEVLLKFLRVTMKLQALKGSINSQLCDISLCLA
jgi:hypothetical protein